MPIAIFLVYRHLNPTIIMEGTPYAHTVTVDRARRIAESYSWSRDLGVRADEVTIHIDGYGGRFPDRIGQPILAVTVRSNGGALLYTIHVDALTAEAIAMEIHYNNNPIYGYRPQ